MHKFMKLLTFPQIYELIQDKHRTSFLKLYIKRKSLRIDLQALLIYERKTGLEPATPTLGRLCSTN